MRPLSENPVFLISKTLKGREAQWLQGSGLFVLGFCLFFAPLVLLITGLCSCTIFTALSAVVVLLSTLMIGGQALTAISRERDLKTFDLLRLTALTAGDIIIGKLAAEFFALLRLLAAAAPALFITGLLSEYGITGALMVLVIALLSGIFSLLAGLILSISCRNTSQAVVLGITLKVIWLLGTPLLDLVVGAVFVSHCPPPVFSSLCPFIAVYALVLPQAMSGAWSVLPWSFFILMPLAILTMWSMASKLYSTGGPVMSYSKRGAHDVFKKGWGGKWAEWLGKALPSLAKVFTSNPVFLREIAHQKRLGAGRIFGYLVFIAIFIAPYLYARCWGISEYSRSDHGSYLTPHVIQSTAAPRTSAGKGPASVIRTYTGKTFLLKGHSLNGCLRWTMYRSAGIPLPEKLIEELTYHNSQPTWSQPRDNSVNTLTEKETSGERTSRLSSETLRNVDTQAIKLGLIGAIWMLLIYLAIRGCCFTVSSITGERDRRSWDDLVLAGFTPEQILAGKLLGALTLPLIQLTVVFPLLLIFTCTGNLTVPDILSLYLYAVMTLITSAVLGLWASATSNSTHQAHGKALGWVIFFFMAVPILSPLLFILSFMTAPFLIIATLFSVRNSSPKLLAASGILILTVISTSSISPMLSPLSFLPSITPDFLPTSLLSCIFGTVTGTFLNLCASLSFLAILSFSLWRTSRTVLALPGDVLLDSAFDKTHMRGAA
ncbi:MAG: ABC transporter permease subunit [Candidatus Xenobiia bacterium LiM19]